MIGSSHILSNGYTGDYGPRGPSGATGGTGAGATNCSSLSIGNTASYIESIIQTTSPYADYGKFLITYSDASTNSIDAFPAIGNTLFDATGVTLESISNISIVRGVSFDGILGSGSTANFKFKYIASNASGLTISNDANFIYIDAPVTPYSASGFTTNGLLYFDTLDTLSTITTDIRYTNNNLYFNTPGTSYTSRTSLITHTTIKDIESTIKGSAGVTLDVSEAGMFVINTPNGIMGFTGFPGISGSTGEILSITLIIENDSIWNFPQNVYFRTKENNLTCGKNILNLTTQNNGARWDANFFGKGFDAFPGNCIPSQMLGSCIAGSSCENYITKEICDDRDGNFCPLSLCVDTGAEDEMGACCVNGICKDGVSKFLCEKYKGRHWSATQTHNGGCSVIKCWDPCYPEETSCCDGITCHDRYTKEECDIISGVFNNSICTVNICNQKANIPGACCIGNECFENLTYNECVYRSGVFMGIGEECTDINCDCTSSNTICTAGQTKTNSSGVCLRVFDISLIGLPINTDGSIDLCFTTQSFTIADRFILLKTKDTDPDTQTCCRGVPGSLYGGECPVDLNTWKTAMEYEFHPFINCLNMTNIAMNNQVIYDSRCVTGTKKKNIKIISGQVELENTNDPWYKKIRLFVMGACQGTTPNSIYNFEFGCNMNNCETQPLQSVQQEINIYKTLTDYTVMQVIDIPPSNNFITEGQ